MWFCEQRVEIIFCIGFSGEDLAHREDGVEAEESMSRATMVNHSSSTCAGGWMWGTNKRDKQANSVL